MTWVRTVDAEGSLPNVLASHTLNREVLRAHVGLYRAIMYGDSPLSRMEREAIAVAVSAVNDCHY